MLVAKVQVTMLNEGGQVLEQREAIRSEGDSWEFAPHARGVVIIAEAGDLPGHVARLDPLPVLLPNQSTDLGEGE